MRLIHDRQISWTEAETVMSYFDVLDLNASYDAWYHSGYARAEGEV